MAVDAGQLIIYASSGMPEDDSAVTGGDINSGIRLQFDDLDASTTVTAYSSSRIDRNTLTVYGRNNAGSIVNEDITVSGTGLSLAGSTTFSGIFKASLSHSTGVGVVTVSGTSQNIVATIPINESGFRLPFYAATADAGSSKTFYEKVFVKNRSGASTLNAANVIQVSDTGVSSKITFGLENGKACPGPFLLSGVGPTGLVANRLTVPSHVDSFGSGTSGVWPSGTGNLEPTAYQGIWLKLSLDAGEGKIDSFYEIDASGMS